MRTLLRLLLLTCVAALARTPADAQLTPPPPPPISSAPAGGPQVITEPAKPVIINGKRASDLNDDELLDFLQSKIQTVEQGDGDILLLHLAPGYALTLNYEEPVQAVIMGDPALASYERSGRTVVLSAKQRAGDTNMKVMFPGSVIREYHVFIQSSFAKADNTFKVTTPKTNATGGGGATESPYVSSAGAIDIKSVSKIVANYDAMLTEKAIDTRRIKRTQIARKSEVGSWVYYYTFAFPGGMQAISFSYRNPYSNAQTFDPSRLRIQFGDVRFVPDFASMEKQTLRPGESSSGFVVFAHPPFSLAQPFEIVWR